MTSLGCLALVSSCRKSTPAAVDAGLGSSAPHEETAIAIVSPHAASDAGAPRRASLRPRSPAKADDAIAIAASTFRAGSAPGDVGRDPASEPPAYDATLSAYTIDALPFPNDPAQPSKVVRSVAEAEKSCASAGKRLCTELEWEHACKGSDDDAYASGATWDAACDRDPSSCASELGVRALGAIRELTASRFEGASGNAVRGGLTHRCSARAKDSALGAAFRCCAGDPNAASMPAIADNALAPFRPMAIDAPHLTRILAGAPELARIGNAIHFFDDADVTKRTDAGPLRAGLVLTASPIAWSPAAGVELLVATGRGASSSFVVAFWRIDDDVYRLAASLLFDDDETPVALLYDPHQRTDLKWTSCIGCTGEEGSVVLRPDHTIAIVQK